MSKFTVTAACGTTRSFDNRQDAEDGKDTHTALCQECHDTDDVTITATDADGEDASTDGGESTHEPAVEPEPVTPEPVTEDLPDEGPSISEDPLAWMPSDFTKTVDGTVTITRKGYEVLAHHYDIQGGTEMVVSPVDTDMEYVVHKASVVDADGDEYTAYGEAHASDNGVENIVRMSDTRAYKRAVSRATGVGTVAIEELQGEL